MRLALCRCCFRWRHKLISAANERRRLYGLMCASLMGLLLAWSFLLHHGLELRDLASLLRPSDLQAALPKSSPSSAKAGCPPNASCIGFATRAFGSFKYWTTVLQPDLVPACASNCRLVADPADAHAVLFHAFDLPSRRRLGRLRRSELAKQLWIFYSLESPVHLVTNRCVRDCSISPWLPFAGSALAFAKEFAFPSYLLRPYPDTTEEAGFFNWTVTYRRDSTVYTPYSRYAPLTAGDGAGGAKQWSAAPPPRVNLAEKKHLSFIVVSNCQPFNRRPQILAELAKHMELHIYGACGDRALPSTQSIVDLSKRYYFYLSFENAFCRDYITEKFFTSGLWGHAVPVAFAGYSKVDLEAVSPPNSFLYAGDFRSPAKLAERLRHLAASPAEYGAYHSWRLTHGIVDQAGSPLYNTFCQICRKLRSAKPGSVEQTDLNRFYDSGRQCRPADFDPFAAT